MQTCCIPPAARLCVGFMKIGKFGMEDLTVSRLGWVGRGTEKKKIELPYC